MNKSFGCFASLAVTILVSAIGLGCAATPVDPTSREALQKAPPMAFGTTCTKVEYSSYGSSTSHSETPVCLDNWDCGTMDSSSARDYAAGADYYGDTHYADVAFFEGTCAEKKPITCDERPAANDCDTCQYSQCCTRVALCEDDPNCVAIADCVNTCKDDQACATRCLNNGDSTASSNLKAAAQCVQSRCAVECGL